MLNQINTIFILDLGNEVSSIRNGSHRVKVFYTFISIFDSINCVSLLPVLCLLLQKGIKASIIQVLYDIIVVMNE